MNTKEQQYKVIFDAEKKHGRSKLGVMFNESWNEDPKRSLFTLARYKFVAKMLVGKGKVLEVGCADAFGTRLIQQICSDVSVCDFDPIFIEDVEDRQNKHWPLKFFVHDMVKSPVEDNYEAIYLLDVLEHVDKRDEKKFISNCIKSLEKQGVMIVGIPSIESQKYASKQSKEGHVNCTNGEEFRSVMLEYFENVFMFSMNDEVVHTGYFGMSHYLIAVACGKKD